MTSFDINLTLTSLTFDVDTNPVLPENCLESYLNVLQNLNKLKNIFISTGSLLQGLIFFFIKILVS